VSDRRQIDQPAELRNANRRSILKAVGKFALIAAPAIVLSAAMSSNAAADSGSDHEDHHSGNNGHNGNHGNDDHEHEHDDHEHEHDDHGVPEISAAAAYGPIAILMTVALIVREMFARRGAAQLDG
jgi:ABC-type Zn2+ transport system substrate-binding protein/surface adhesin